MIEYTVEIQTIHGIADSDYLDRLAEIVYGLPELIDPLLGLDDDGSISASFGVSGSSARDAALRGVDAFANAIVAAKPLRIPTEDELEDGEEAVGRFAVHPTEDREAVPA